MVRTRCKEIHDNGLAGFCHLGFKARLGYGFHILWWFVRTAHTAECEMKKQAQPSAIDGTAFPVCRERAGTGFALAEATEQRSQSAANQHVNHQ